MKFALAILIFITLLFCQLAAFDASRCLIFDMPRDQMERNFGRLSGTELSEAELRSIQEYQFTGDTFMVLVIPVEWTNRPATYSVETLDSMLFLENGYPRGSLADFFKEVSYGAITVAGTVLDWYNAGTYANNGYFNFTPILANIDPYVDYSQFDGDHDGNVDGVIFLRSGTGEEDSKNPEDIWSYAAIWPLGSGEGPFDGVLIPRWNTSPELKPLHFPAIPSLIIGDTLNNIGVFCHELSHNMGLPDLYDYDDKLDTNTYFTPNDYNDHPMMDWGLMGYYGYSIFSLGVPTAKHMCGWSRKTLGWITEDTVIGEHNDLVLYDINTHSDSALYLLPIDNSTGEYFLLEYRDPYAGAQFGNVNSDFSVYFYPDLAFGPDTLEQGLMITHVHDSAAPYWSINNGTPDYRHYAVAVEDAGYNPAQDMFSNPEGRLTDSAQWWYPYETRLGALFTNEVPGKDNFNQSTIPNSDGYNWPTWISVRVDSIVDEKLYLYVNVPRRPTQYDTISTPCLNLTVGNNGDVGNQGMAGCSMDYSGSGDCDETATTYLFDGSPVITYNNGSEDVIYHSLYRFEKLISMFGNKAPVPTQTTDDYQVYESGTLITPDSALAIELKYWAPNNLDSCNFIIQRMKIYSFDGQAHGGLNISEIIDWDIPTDEVATVANDGGFEEADRLIYSRGIESDGAGCQRNDARYGGQAMLGYYINDSTTYDNGAGPYSAKVIAFSDLMSNYDIGPQASYVESVIQNPGYEILGTGDIVNVMTFFYNYDLGAEDTLNVMTALSTVMNDNTAADKAAGSQLQKNIARALEWSNVYLFGMDPSQTYICGDANGDVSVNIVDASFIVNYIFFSGVAPDPIESGDANNDGSTNIVDASYIVNYIFFGGAAPCAAK